MPARIIGRDAQGIPELLPLLAGISWTAGWLHLQAIGPIGLMILAVMARATLGHTGRPLVAAPAMIVAWLVLPAAALLRVFGPAVLPGVASYAAAGLLWLLAFGLFLLAYGGMPLRARADGRPG